MGNFKIFLIFSILIGILILSTNVVVSAQLIDNQDNCLTCTPIVPPPPPTPPGPPAPPAPPTPALTPSPPICQNCPPSDCSMVPEGTTFPYASHCKLYYKCINKTAVECICANGYWYDRALYICQLCPLVKNCPANAD